MRRASRRISMGRACAGAVLLFVCTCLPMSAAAEPFLALRLDGGQGRSYELSSLKRLTFDGGSLQVVNTGGTDTYAPGSIVRIDFNLDEWTGIEHAEPAQDLARTLYLFQSQPNPFSPETQIAFALPQAGRAELRIYAVNGRLVRTLVDTDLAAGSHVGAWDGLDASGLAAPSGVYFYTLVAQGIEERRKMLLVR